MENNPFFSLSLSHSLVHNIQVKKYTYIYTRVLILIVYIVFSLLQVTRICLSETRVIN